MSAFNRLCAIVGVVSTMLMYVLLLGVLSVVVMAGILTQFTIAVHGTNTEAWTLERPQLLSLLATLVAVGLTIHVVLQAAKRIALRMYSASYRRLSAMLEQAPETTLRKLAWWDSGRGSLAAMALLVVAMVSASGLSASLAGAPIGILPFWVTLGLRASLAVGPIAILAFWVTLVAAGIARAILDDAAGGFTTS